MTNVSNTLSPNSKNDDSFFKAHRQKFIALILWGLFFGAYFWYARVNNLGFSDILRQAVNILTHPIFGPLIFILLYILRPVLLFSATILSLVGGSIFGPISILWTILGSNSGALLAYGIGRFFGAGLLEGDESESTVQRYANRMRNNSFETVLLMRFTYVPYDLVNYLSGFLQISWKPFLLATALGSIPGTVWITLFGASLPLEDVLAGTLPPPNPWLIAISFGMFALSLILSRVLKKREGKTTPA